FNNSEYANLLSSHATSLFSLAETARPQQVYQTVVPDVNCCYPSSNFWDELAWGAAWLYKLTKDFVYLSKAKTYVSNMNSGLLGGDDLMKPVTWDDKSGLVYILLSELTQGSSDYFYFQSLAEQYADFTSKPTKSTNCQM